MSKRKMIFKKNLVAHALVMAFGASVLTIGVMPTAMAQSNAAGTLYGSVPPGAANSVTIKSTATNATRVVQIGVDGKFQATALQPGIYEVTAMKDKAIVSSGTVDVLAGQGSEVVLNTAGVQTVQVSAKRTRIDVTNANNGATFTAKELDKLPVGRNIQAVIQLAPNTTKSDPGYPAASFAGGGASENSYYINGYAVTNSFNQLGSSELPFGAISQAQVLVGGFGAEFGRSVGGVVNVTTKSGTNKWETGAMASWSPNAFRSKPKDLYYPVIGAANTKATDGTLNQRREDNKADVMLLGAYVGGPIIEDKLFMFVSAESTRTETSGVNQVRTSSTLAGNGWFERETKLQRYMAKFDWNISDDHRIEFTALGDLPKTDERYKSYNYDTRAVGQKVNSSNYRELTEGSNGGASKILRYIGNFTDNLTLTALAGQTKQTLKQVPAGYNPNLFQVFADPNNRAPGLNYTSGQNVTAAQISPDAKSDVKSYRLDLEYRIGQHTVRGGIDKVEMSSLNHGSETAGGGSWVYARSLTPTGNTPVSGGVLPPLSTYGGLAAQGYYVGKNLNKTISNAYAGQNAQYIEDRYQATKNILLTFGLRAESYFNANSSKEKYIEMKNQIAPRFQAVWDVNNDASLKVFGSAGRYNVPLPAMMALRGANGPLNTSQYYVYTGTDSNGLPTGLTEISKPISQNGEYGQPYDGKTLAAVGLKSNYQDEISLGFEKAHSTSLNFGVKGTYRLLKSSIDDLCDNRPFVAWAKKNNVDYSKYSGAEEPHGCQLFNPGLDNTFMVDFADADPATARKKYHTVALTAADIGFPKATRSYAALDFFAEHPYVNGWYGRINYTLSRNKGNTEGQTRSDGNGAQGDIAMTATWDYKEQAIGGNGLLPNDRTHQIKAFGFYDISSQFTVGANLILASGRPISCQGAHSIPPNPADPYNPNYSNANFFCGGGADYTKNVVTPRGSLGRTAWENQIDINFAYKPDFLKGMSVKMDIFNLFDNQYVTKVNEVYNNGAKLQSNLYGGVNAYNAGRSGRITIQYDRKF